MTKPPRGAHASLPELLLGIIAAAREKFPGQDWTAVENHIRRAWNAVSHDAGSSWADVRGHVRREWEAAD